MTSSVDERRASRGRAIHGLAARCGGRDQGPPHRMPRFELFSGLARASLARARHPGGRGYCPPRELWREGYSFFASLSSLAISRRVVSPFTVSMGLSFSKVLRPMPLIRTTCIGSANGLAVR